MTLPPPMPSGLVADPGDKELEILGDSGASINNSII